MTRVRVQRIESIRDPEGNLGKKIELIEDRAVPSFALKPRTEEARVVQDVIQTMRQQIPIMGARTQFAMPKIILFLTEQEYDMLGIDFDVNQVYKVELENRKIHFKKTE